MDTPAILKELDSEIAKLEAARAALTGGAIQIAPRKPRVLSADARERIAAAQRKRWAKQKKGVQSASGSTTRKAA